MNFKRLLHQIIGFILGLFISLLWIEPATAISILISLILASLIVNYNEYSNK